MLIHIFLLKQDTTFLGSDGKELAWNAGDPGSIPGSERSPEEGNGNPLQYSCLENPMDRGAWQITVRGVVKDTTEWLYFFNYFRPWIFVLLHFSVMAVLLSQRYNKELRYLDLSQRSFCCVLCIEVIANKEESPDFPHYPSYIYMMACVSQKLPSPS